MKYAIIKIGNRQFTVKEGEVFQVEKQSEPLNFSIVAFSDGKTLMVDPADLKDVKVGLKITGDKRERKIIVGKFKAKSRYRKMRGHRQDLSLIKVSNILAKGEEAKAEVEEAKAEKPVKKTVAKKEVKTKAKVAPKAKTVKKTSKKLVKDEK